MDERTRSLPVLPIKNDVLFPNMLMPMMVSRPLSLAAVEAAMATEDKLVAMFTQRAANVDLPREPDLHRLGTLAVIKKMTPIDDTLHIVVQGVERIELLGLTQDEPFLKGRVRLLPELEAGDTQTEATHRAMVELAVRLLELVQPPMQINLNYVIAEAEEPERQAYLLASLLPLDTRQELALLEASSRLELYQRVHDYLAHEIQVQEVRKTIASHVEDEVGKAQREYLLRQQMRAIQQELGEQRPEQEEVAELRQRLEQTDLPELVRREVAKELDRLERMHAAAPDYQLTRSYLELALDLPWYRTTEDNLDLDRAQAILDEDHFDLADVKQRIVEHLAVMKLNPEAKAPILCLVGAPGVGKTSVGQSIGRALGRKFERMSLGGLHDEAELRGHRRTYIGAMPGRIIQAIRRAGVRNPLLMLDEVDKLGIDFRGDPAAALMEILDPAQNFEFHDNYLDLPYDLSKVFFITTANTLDTIPRPLLDRMEVLRLAGYTDEEKREIARRYLIPRQVTQAGIAPGQLAIPDDTLAQIIRRYTREAGVRELERVIGRLARKVATQVARGATEAVTATPETLLDLLGPEQFYAEQARKELRPGVAAGLAWTESGGDVLYVEAVILPGSDEVILTGHLGEVMQESAKAARSYIWSHAGELNLEPSRIQKTGVHIHVPAGAVPKDGPSAGVTMLTALVSVYAGKAPRSDTAMTGEITLSGLVMPVGGIKEKVLAAHRAGIPRIILPRENEKDLAELPEQVRQEMQFVFAATAWEVIAEAIPQLVEQRGQAMAR